MTSGQNRSSAVMAQRHSVTDALDFFPTPRWGTRALCEFIIDNFPMKQQTVWEPACGQGHMSESLKEYFGHVQSTDVFSYGYGDIFDFLSNKTLLNRDEHYVADWIITNPPFLTALQFARIAIQSARCGVAMLARSTWWESEEREEFFDLYPPTYYCPFTGRLPMFKGRISRSTATATAYAWFVWLGDSRHTIVRRIPFKAKRLLDRATDWDPSQYGKRSPYPPEEPPE